MHFTIVTRGETMTGEDGTLPNIQLRALKKVQFDAGEEKETFFK